MDKPVYNAALVRHLETLEDRIVMSVTTYGDTVSVVNTSGQSTTYTATVAYESNDLSAWESHFSAGLDDLGEVASSLESEGAYLEANPDGNLQTPAITDLETLGGTTTTDGLLMDFFGPVSATSNALKTQHSLSSVTTFAEFAAYSGNPSENPTGISNVQEARDRVEAIGQRLQVMGARANVIKNSLAGSGVVVQMLKAMYYNYEVQDLRNETRALAKELKWIDLNYPNR